MTWGRSWVRAVLPPVVFGLLFVAAWEVFVRAADIRAYVLAAPSAILRETGDRFHNIAVATGHSGLNALVGLAVGTVLGVLLAALCGRLALLGQTFAPLVAALAAVPIVCLAPILNNMYSLTSTIPRREVVAISAFVPIFINTLRGLQHLAPVHAELMASYAASGTDVLRTIRIPGALPHFFTGLRIAASLAVIASVVSEYFGGLKDGLGSRITDNVKATDYPAAWASVLGAVVLGLAFFLAALAVERLVLGRQAAGLT
ncbi:MAG TPA: ABC transporter permease subunit [Nocardioides sp.]|nr:ABC transporter permease subunit [Nocardioides sp.]